MITELLTTIPPIASSSGGWIWLLILIGPAGGSAVYWMIYRYYRNTDKTHQFERETRIESRPIQGQDQLIRSFRGIKRSAIQGRNERKHRTRVQRR